MLVVQACSLSQRAGVVPGMALAHARALLPDDTIVEPYQPQRDAISLAALARWAFRFTPVVQINAPDGLLLEITGCDHLFGGKHAMLQRVVNDAQRLSLHAHAAIGPTVGCAWALARFGPANAIVHSLADVAEAITPLPIQALRIDSDVEQSLNSVAVETIGQLVALPRDSLADRFGPSLLLRIDQALSQAFEAVHSIRPTEPLEIERSFAGPVKQLEAILQTGRELITELCQKLAQREAGARQLRLDLERIDTQNLAETITFSRPTRHVKHLWIMLRPHIEQIHMGYGIERVTLTATATAPLPHEQTTPHKWPGKRASFDMDRAIGELVDQLTGRLGRDRVCEMTVQATHVPEQAFAYRPAPFPQASADQTSVVDADRPTLLYRHPQPIQVMLLAPDGPVITFAHRGQTLGIRTTIGPERITCRWWLIDDEKRKPVPRDYFKVQDDCGRWWWLFRQVGASRWFIHGRWC